MNVRTRLRALEQRTKPPDDRPTWAVVYQDGAVVAGEVLTLEEFRARPEPPFAVTFAGLKLGDV